nr:MAG TPA: RanBP1 domain [Caudoviricetes sp.]
MLKFLTKKKSEKHRILLFRIKILSLLINFPILPIPS